MDTLVIDRHNLHAVMPARAAETKSSHITAYYKGVSFEVGCSAEDSKMLTKNLVNEYITECLKAGKSLNDLKRFWSAKMDMFVDIYNQKIEANRYKYVGKPMEILVNDIMEEVWEIEEFNKANQPHNLVQWFLLKWIMGVGVLLKLKVISDEDEDNGFVIFTGPDSLLRSYDEFKRDVATERAEKEKKDLEPTLP